MLSASSTRGISPSYTYNRHKRPAAVGRTGSPMGDTRTGGGVNSTPPPNPSACCFHTGTKCVGSEHKHILCILQMIIHPLNPITLIHSASLGVILHWNSFIYTFFEKSAHSLASFPPLLMPSFPPFLLPLNPFHPLFLPTISALGSHTPNLLFLSEGGLFIKALSFPNTDLSITKLHLHTYCCLTPCAKYSFVKPSPIPCLYLVEIAFFLLQALLSIQAGLGWHKHHTAVPLGKLIVKGSGWGFESALCYFYDSCRFFFAV